MRNKFAFFICIALLVSLSFCEETKPSKESEFSDLAKSKQEKLMPKKSLNNQNENLADQKAKINNQNALISSLQTELDSVKKELILKDEKNKKLNLEFEAFKLQSQNDLNKIISQIQNDNKISKENELKRLNTKYDKIIENYAKNIKDLELKNKNLSEILVNIDVIFSQVIDSKKISSKESFDPKSIENKIKGLAKSLENKNKIIKALRQKVDKAYNPSHRTLRNYELLNDEITRLSAENIELKKYSKDLRQKAIELTNSIELKNQINIQNLKKYYETLILQIKEEQK